MTNEPTKNQEENVAAETAKDEVAKLKEERDEYLRGWQRAKADFVNYKKEELKRMEDVVKYGQEEMIRELITIMDNFDLGLAAMEKQGEVEKGVYMIRAQLEDMLKRYGLEKVNLKPGDPFDPNIAEAIVEVEGDGPPGSIAEEIEPGYRLHHRLVRPARVKVIKSKE